MSRTELTPPALEVTPRPFALRRIDAVTVLSVYLLLLLAVPSSLTITALGSAGRPASLWALGAALWWASFHLQRQDASPVRHNIVRLMILSLMGVVLVSYGAAMLRGLPFNEVSPADNGILRWVGWVAIALVACDGIRDGDRFRTLLRRIAIAGALMASLGILQFLTGQTLLTWINIPGFSSDLGGVEIRGGYVRASGTAIHPLEYGMVLCVSLPVAISLALHDLSRSWFLRWPVVAVISMAAVLSVSRSALVGIAVGVLILFPGWSRQVRILAISAGGLLLVAVAVAVPGLLATLRGLFTGISGDSSALSRVNSYDDVIEIVGNFPVVGKGFGTFLPSYRILDNQYLLFAVELGVLGIVAFAGLVIVSMISAGRSTRRAASAIERDLCRALIASVAAGAVLFAFFDGLSFPMSAGLIFLMIGISGASPYVSSTSVERR